MSVNRQRQRGAAQNSVYTWQTIATEMKALPEQLENRSEDMVQRTAPALIQSLVTKVNGLRDFGADALFGLHDAMESWSSSRLDGFSSPLTEAINARNEAEAQGRPRSGNNCAGQQLCDCPHIVFTQRELDRLGDASLTDVAALELIAMRGSAIGITNAAEETRRWWTAFHVNFCFERNGHFPTYHKIYDDAIQFGRLIANAKNARCSGLKCYPRMIEQWPRDVMQRAYSEDAPPVVADLPSLTNLATHHVPLRSNSRLLVDEAARTRRDLEANCARGKRLYYDTPRRQPSLLHLQGEPQYETPPRLAIEFKPRPPARATTRLALTNSAYDGTPTPAPMQDYPPRDEPRVVHPPSTIQVGLRVPPPVRTDYLADHLGAPAEPLASADAETAAMRSEIEEVHREDAAFNALIKRDKERKDEALSKAQAKRKREREIEATRKMLRQQLDALNKSDKGASASDLDAAAKDAADAQLGVGDDAVGPKRVLKRPAHAAAAVPAAKAKATKGVIKVAPIDLAPIRAEVKDYKGRREAFGCKGYSLVNSKLSADDDKLAETRKWARGELVKIWDKRWGSAK